jgi:hypothetical protein
VELVAHDPEGAVLAAPTNCVFTGRDRATIVVPNIAARHLTRFSIPGVWGVPLVYPEPGLLDP